MTNQIMGTPFFLSTDNVPSQFPWLDKSSDCEIAIIGGGIAGAMAAYKLSKAGIKVVLLSESPIGYSTTAASQGVASYQLTGGLTGLAQKIGMDMAVSVYSQSVSAVNILEDIIKELTEEVPYARKDSLIYSDTDTMAFDEEYQALKHNNFNTELINETTAKEKFSFSVKSALYTPGSSIECDPYRLNHALCQAAVQQGAEVYENTPVESIIQEDTDDYTIYTAHGKTVTSSKVLLAAGIETARELHTATHEKTTFNLVTRPVDGFSGWFNRAVIAKTGCDNIRLRTTPDNRIIISGLDCGVAGLKSGIISQEKMADKKYDDLYNMLQQMFPGIRNIQPEFNFSFNYSETDMNLPIIGESDGIFYDLCPAENGIVFSIIAADLITSRYMGNYNEEMALYEQELNYITQKV